MNPTSVQDAQEMSKITCFTDEKRYRVYVQSVPVCFRHHAHMCFNMCAWCRYTRGRFESAPGGFFLRAKPRHTPHHTHNNTTQHTTQTHTHHTNHAHQHATTHGDRDRDRDRDRERRQDGRGETRQEKRRQKKTRQDQRREKIHFQCGGAWPFFVDVVIFWLIPFALET